MKYPIFILTAVVLLGGIAHADPEGDGPLDPTAAVIADTLQTDAKGNTLILPVLGYTPDTKFLFGAALLRFFYLEKGPEVRPSVFSPIFIYTVKNQIMVFLGTDLHWGQARWHAKASPSYVKFPDQFYGVGRDVSLDDEEDYTPERISFEGLVERESVGELRVGVSYRVMKHQVKEMDPGGILDSGAVPGTGTSWVSAPGLALGIDTRDNTWYPSHGVRLALRVDWARDWVGSDFDFEQVTLDLRGYRALGETTVLAGQFKLTSVGGAPPFFMLPVLGGDEGLRGYRGSLYRDRVASLARIEIRRWGLWRRLGAVAFAGIGDVAPRVSGLTLSRQLWSAGAGLRFAFDKKERVNIRVDFGFGNGDSGFFLSLGEAF